MRNGSLVEHMRDKINANGMKEVSALAGKTEENTRKEEQTMKGFREKF